MGIIFVVPLLDMQKEVIQPNDCNPETIKAHFDEMIRRGILEIVPPICGRNEKLTPAGSCLPERDDEFGEEKPDTSIRDATALKRNAPSVCEDEVYK